MDSSGQQACIASDTFSEGRDVSSSAFKTQDLQISKKREPSQHLLLGFIHGFVHTCMVVSFTDH